MSRRPRPRARWYDVEMDVNTRKLVDSAKDGYY